MKTLFLFALLCLPMAGSAQTGLGSDWVAFNRAGAPNSNLQCFTPNNVSVENGNLVIVTKRENAICASIDLPLATFNYTSGFVSMRKFNFLYGQVEFRAKFGGGERTGAWPIVWMEDASCQPTDPTGTGEGCTGQEIDIAEIMHGEFSDVNEQIHVGAYAHEDGCTAHTKDVSKRFHVYQLDWSQASLVFRIDGKRTCKIEKSYVPSTPMYLKIDNFVGSYGGPVRNKTLPWTTLVDYVKVTQNSKVIFFDDFEGNPNH